MQTLSHTSRLNFAANETWRQLATAVCIGLLSGASTLIFSPVNALVLVLGGLLLVAIASWPELSLLAIVIGLSTVFPEQSIPVINVGPGRLLATDILLAVPLILILLRWMVKPGFRPIRSPLTPPFLVFYGIAILSTIIALSSGRIGVETAIPETRILSYYLTFFIAANMLQDEKRLTALIKGLFAIASLTALAVLLQFILGDSVVVLPGRVETLNTAGREFSGVTRILIPGQSLIMVVFWVSLALLVVKRSAHSLPLYVVWILTGIALLLTFTRSYWLSVLLELAFILVLTGIPHHRQLVQMIRRSFWIVPVCVLAGMLIYFQPEPNRFASLFHAAVERFQTVTDGETLAEHSLRFRALENDYALEHLRHQPLRFLGLGMGASYRPLDFRLDYLSTDGSVIDGTRYIHQAHLGIIVKGGLLSYLGLVTFSILFFWRSFTHWRHIPNPLISGTVLGFSVGFLLILIISFSSPLLLEQFWTPIAGIMLGFNEAAIALYRPTRVGRPAAQATENVKPLPVQIEGTALPHVSVVIVNYNTAHLLKRCLQSLFAESPNLALEVIVVDNASTDDSCELVRRDFPQVRLIANDENKGISIANNQGMRVSTGRYILLLNPDTEICDRAIERMVAFLDAHPHIAACGSKLYYPDGTYQRSAQPLPTLFSPFYEYSAFCERLPFLSRLLCPGWIDRPDNTRPVGYCATACFLVSRTCIERIGLMDEAFFLYGDDVDWCRRMWEAKSPVYFYAESRVIHFEGGAQRTAPGRRLRELKGEMQYLRKWHGRTYTQAYHLLAKALCTYRYVAFRWRRFRHPERAAVLSDSIHLYRAILAGRFEG